MKRFLTFLSTSALILGLTLTGCTNVQSPAAPNPPSQPNQSAQLPEAEAGATRDSVLGPEKRVVMGFYTDAEGPVPSSKETTLKNAKLLDEVAFFWYGFDTSGKVIPAGKIDLKIKDQVQKNGAKAYALVHNMKLKGSVGFDANLAHSVLSNPTKRSNFVTNLVNLTTKDNWDGISIDIEKTPPGDRNNFSAFVAELKKALKAKDKVLNISIPAKFADYPSDLWSGAYDYAAIGKSADQIILMTYDEHGLGTTQGPIASEGWVDRVIKFAVGKIPKEKIVMGLPVYSFDWGTDNPTMPDYLSYAQTVERAKKHGVEIHTDPSAKVPQFTYTANGIRHEVYFENIPSLRAKMDNALQYKLHGVAVWRLGMEDPRIWDQLLKTYGTNKETREKK
ncbi:putative glycosyl hydrolase [Desulfosporosinus orientis DSM 765]|uniref:Putative glycosyl hydrolase n=1 Tax=Desulfosporosinus orientis (strain ATCC 19365 / DSM 765 / NCIMB 8382 / VKM B-1628 / Singapore I) TaxID=768706 RepID=G7W7D1_DESOD|nr:glycosyl hydrolase family 18 protein [Desulfosporosinus orientis]AET65802.1 putative glycosyl hydrolase [Desulfosporosinus orientis DSM 765]